MAQKAFISYRRQDDASSARQIYEAMAARFGKDNVFFDRTSIAGGAPWKERIIDSLSGSAVLLVVIGPRWTDVMSARQQLEGQEDEHVFEIVKGFELGLRVVPILIDRTPMPTGDTLPPEIRDHLAGCNAMELENDRFWDTKLAYILDDLADTLGAPGSQEAGAAEHPQATGTEITVGPMGSSAEFHEIADAVASAKAGARVRVAAGRYLKPLVLDRNIHIVIEDAGTATLEPETSPCVQSKASDATIVGLDIKATSPTGGVGVVVTGGTLALSKCTIQSEWPEQSFVGLRASGEPTRTNLDQCRFLQVDTAIHFTELATGKVEDSTVEGPLRHAVVIDQGANPHLRRCTFEGAGSSTIVIADHGKGIIHDCTIGRGRGATIEVHGGGAPIARGSIVGGGAGASAKTDARGRLEQLVDRDPNSGWHVQIHDGGAGQFQGCHLAVLETTAGASPNLDGCRIDTFSASDGGVGNLRNCKIGSVTISTAANPLITGGSTIDPGRVGRVAVTVTDGGLGTFEDSEIVGVNIERADKHDPAVLITTDGHPTFARCVITGPEPGTVRITNRGRGRIQRCEITTEARSGPAVLVEGTGTAIPIEGSNLHGGLTVAAAGAVDLEDCEIDAPRSGGTGLTVLAEGSAQVRRSVFHRITSRGVTVAGTAVLEDCKIHSVGSTALTVEDGGSLIARDCTVSDVGTSALQRVGRRLGALSEKVRNQTEKVVAPANAIAVHRGGAARFVRCAIDDKGDHAIDVPPESVAFDDCTLNGAPYVGPPPTLS